MEDTKLIFPTVNVPEATTNTVMYNTAETAGSMGRDGASQVDNLFSHPVQNLHVPAQLCNDYVNLLAQQEPKLGDVAPSVPDFDEEMMKNLRIGQPAAIYEDVDYTSNRIFVPNGRAESVASSGQWGAGGAAGGAAAPAPKDIEMTDTFEFLIKSLSYANNYATLLTREQLSVLRAIRPSLLYEFLQEVAKVRGERRARRALHNECAFCKNNGENEECYLSHSLKDWRGRVLCPVLRAFRCPRCGATGDRAHTIKYCSEPPEGLEQNGFGRRRASPAASSLYLGEPLRAPPSAPLPAASSPSPAAAAAESAASFNTTMWNPFNLN